MTRGGSGTKAKRRVSETARNVRLLILDVDGVLTDGSIILDNKANEYKIFHVRDGHGIKMLVSVGVRTALITGRYSKVVERRAEELGIHDVYQRCLDKRVAYRDLIKRYGFQDAEIAYIGDDIVDIPILAMVGLPVAVGDAQEEVKRHALLVTKNRGGRGAVREVTDLILKAKGVWEGMMDEYFKT